MMNPADETNLIYLQFTPQLFYFASSGVTSPQPAASGLLVTTLSRFFLITCEHVFKDISPEQVIIFTADGRHIQLPQNPLFISTYESNFADIAVFELSLETVNELRTRYNFLHTNNIDFNHSFSKSNEYLLLGFINHQTKLRNEVFEATPFGYKTTIKTLRHITDLGLSHDYNVILNYNRRKQSFVDSKSINFGPRELKGLSGGGIWVLTRKSDRPNTIFAILVGVMTEERTEKGVIIGNKIDSIKKILKTKFGVEV